MMILLDGWLIFNFVLVLLGLKTNLYVFVVVIGGELYALTTH